MNMKKTIVCVTATFLILWMISTASFVVYSNADANTPENNDLEIHFIDVGQADATLIKSPEATKLIDAGYCASNWVGNGDGWETNTLNYLEKHGIEKIDVMIGTHPHADHIGEMDDIIKNLDVGEIWMSGYEYDSATYNNMYDAIKEHNITYRNPRANETYQPGAVKFETINPPAPIDSMDIHESSLGFRTVYEGFTLMFTGDIEKETEKEIVKRNHTLSSDIYHSGHHGSNTSSSEPFLEKMDPEVAIHSSDPDVYGHPHNEVVERMDEMEIEQYKTHEEGTIRMSVEEDGSYEMMPEKDMSENGNDHEDEDSLIDNIDNKTLAGGIVGLSMIVLLVKKVKGK